MRFLYISIEYLEPIFSGNGALARMQTEELLRQGHSLLICCGNELGEQENEPSTDTLVVLSIPIQSKKNLGPDADFITFSKGILDSFDEITEFQPEAIIVDDWHSCLAVIAISESLHIPYFYQYFRIFSRDPTYIPDPYKFQLVRQFEYQLAQNAATNIQLSRDTADWCRENFNVDTHVLYPPLKPSFVEHAFYTSQQPREAPGSCLHLVTFVRISPEKEIDRLLTMLGQFEMNFQLTILGEVVNQEYLVKLQEIIAQFHMKDKIIFDGRVDIDTLIQNITANDAYIHPARYEPFGISIMESAFLGLPIILDISEKIGAGELVEDGVSCIRLNFEDPLSAQLKLQSLLEDSDHWLDIGLQGQKIAQTLKVDQEINQLINMIQEKLN